MGDVTFRLILAVFATVVGSSFQFGIGLATLNIPQTIIQTWINSTNYEVHGSYLSDSSVASWFGVINAMFSVGGAVGAGTISIVASSLGRRNGMIANNFVILIAAVFLFLSKITSRIELLVIGRLLQGVSVGLYSGLAPMYLTEIASKNIRGTLGSAFQMVVTIGIVFISFISFPQVLGSKDNWNYLLAFPIIPAILQLLTLPLCPKSPKFLYLSRNDKQAAISVLKVLRDRDNVEDEIAELEDEYEVLKYEPAVTYFELVRSPFLRKVLIVAVVGMLGQQFSGINAAIFYSTNIFESTGLEANSAQWATIGLDVAQAAATVAAVILVEKAGRKILLIVGYGTMFFCTIILTVCGTIVESSTNAAASYIAVGTIFIFTMAFSIGPGPIPWFIVSELFDQKARSQATTVSAIVNWSGAAVVSGAFPILIQNVSHYYTFLIFTVLLAIFVFYVWRFLPETKGKSTEEIQAVLQIMYGQKYEVMAEKPKVNEFDTVSPNSAHRHADNLETRNVSGMTKVDSVMRIDPA